MVCIYCLQREAVVARRCYPCHLYLARLYGSDEDADRHYATRLVLRAHSNLVARAA